MLYIFLKFIWKYKCIVYYFSEFIGAKIFLWIKCPTNDQFHYLIGKSIFWGIFNDKYQNICLIMENIMVLVG